MKINTINGKTIYSDDDVDNLKDLVVMAAKRGAVLSDAYLSDEYLRGADLSDAYLSGADLCGADLRGADLRRAYLGGAYLGDADLSDANLRYAYLSGADLSLADLRGADLRGADLRGADLSGADLSGADLSDANLSGADLRDTDLSDADLSGANIRGADLRRAENIPFIPYVCPSDGEFTGWKKVNNRLVRLLVPADAKRISATTNKCRCDKAMVMSITNIDETENYTEVTNENFVVTTYKVGEMVFPDGFDDDRWNECSHGIHFFINKQEAMNY